MAHELTIANGVAEMAYVGAKAWHGLGNQLPVGASIEQWKVAAGMQWHIRRAIAQYFADPDGSMDCSMLMPYSDRTVLFRSDNMRPLGLVSPDYEIVQPGQVLEFFRDLVAESGMQLETAGTLFGGRRFWALAKVSESYVTPADKVGGYLLLSTSADGTMATEARETTVRVVCNNTLRMARNENGESLSAIKIPHRVKFDDKKIKDQLGLSREHFENGMDVARALAQVKITNAAAEDYVRQLLRPEEHAQKVALQAASEAAQMVAQGAGASDLQTLMARTLTVSADSAKSEKRAPKGEAAILTLFSRSAIGGELPGASGTLWGLLNAVTEHVDHHASARTPDHRASSAWFGAGDELKTRALDLATRML